MRVIRIFGRRSSVVGLVAVLVLGFLFSQTSSFSAVSAGDPVAAANPWGYWLLDDLSGRAVVDSSGPQRVKHNGDYSFDSPFDPAGVPGFISSAFSTDSPPGLVGSRTFGGSPNYCEGVQLDPSISGISGDFSLELWVKLSREPDGYSSNFSRIFNVIDFDVPAFWLFGKVIDLRVNGQGTIQTEMQFRRPDGSFYSTSDFTSRTVPQPLVAFHANEWHHVSLVRRVTASLDQVTTFVDGTPQQALEYSVTAPGAIRFGTQSKFFLSADFAECTSDTAYAGLEGNLAGVAIFDRALTTAEVIQHLTPIITTTTTTAASSTTSTPVSTTTTITTTTIPSVPGVLTVKIIRLVNSPAGESVYSVTLKVSGVTTGADYEFVVPSGHVPPDPPNDPQTQRHVERAVSGVVQWQYNVTNPRGIFTARVYLLGANSPLASVEVK